MSDVKQATSEVDLEQLVAEADTGGRHAAGITGQILLWTAVAWSLFQLWYASPLPFVVGFGILNDTEARAIPYRRLHHRRRREAGGPSRRGCA